MSITTAEKIRETRSVCPVCLKNIPASQLDTPYTLHTGDGDYDYAVLDYVSSCLAKTGEQANPKTQALVTAMYYYNKAANAYFAD